LRRDHPTAVTSAAGDAAFEENLDLANHPLPQQGERIDVTDRLRERGHCERSFRVAGGKSSAVKTARGRGYFF
jgi:hypothetical protein